MYISQFWCGFLACVAIEFVTIVVFGICSTRGKGKKEDEEI